MGNTVGAKKRRCKWYQESILVPGVKDHQLVYDNLDSDAIPSVPVEETAVVWCDGDIPYIDAVTGNLKLFVNNAIIAKKQHAAGAGAEQPADLAKVFRVLKELLPSHIVRDLPPERCPMKKLIPEARVYPKKQGK